MFQEREVVTTKRRMRADAERNRTKVVTVAAKVLARDGETAPFRNIARQAEIRLASIYRQFPTKQALFEAIMVECLERLVERATAATETQARSIVTRVFTPSK